jgi:ferredoxin
MLRFSLIHHRRTTKPCSVFLPLPSVYRSNRPVTGPYRAVCWSEPNELAFQFGIWIWSLFSGNRGLPTGLPKPRASGSGDRFGKLNPGPHCRRMFFVQCKVAWHDGITCTEFQRLGKDERGKNDLLLRKVARESKWQRCPKCKMYVERTVGCMYIVCRYCFAACILKLHVQRAHNRILHSILQVPASLLLHLRITNVQGHTSLQQVQEDLVNDLNSWSFRSFAWGKEVSELFVKPAIQLVLWLLWLALGRAVMIGQIIIRSRTTGSLLLFNY